MPSSPNKSFPGIIQRSRPVAEVARSYGLVPQTVGNWVAKWRTEHPEPGAENSSSEENAEIRRLKAELREARMEAEPLEESGGLLRSGVPVSTKYGFIRSEEGNYPVRSMCRWAKVSRSGYYAWRDRPGSATAKRRQDLTVIIARFFADSDQTYGYRRIRAGPRPTRDPGRRADRPEDHGRQRNDSLSAQEEGPYHRPGCGPSRPA